MTRPPERTEPPVPARSSSTSQDQLTSTQNGRNYSPPETVDKQRDSMCARIDSMQWSVWTCIWTCRIVVLHTALASPRLYNRGIRAVNEKGLPVAQGTVRDPFGAVAGHDVVHRRRLRVAR